MSLNSSNTPEIAARIRVSGDEEVRAKFAGIRAASQQTFDSLNKSGSQTRDLLTGATNAALGAGRAASDAVSYTIGTVNDGLSKLGPLAGIISGKLAQVSEVLGLAGFGASAGIIASGLAVTQLAKDNEESIEGIKTVAATLGWSAKEVSTFQSAIRLAGGETDDLKNSADELHNVWRKVVDGGDQFAKPFLQLGVPIRDAVGNLRSFQDIARDTFSQLRAIGPGDNQNDAAEQLLGDSGKSILKILNPTGKDTLESRLKKAATFDNVFDDKRLKEFEDSKGDEGEEDEWKENVQHIRNAVTKAFNPLTGASRFNPNRLLSDHKDEIESLVKLAGKTAVGFSNDLSKVFGGDKDDDENKGKSIHKDGARSSSNERYSITVGDIGTKKVAGVGEDPKNPNNTPLDAKNAAAILAEEGKYPLAASPYAPELHYKNEKVRIDLGDGAGTPLTNPDADKVKHFENDHGTVDVGGDNNLPIDAQNAFQIAMEDKFKNDVREGTNGTLREPPPPSPTDFANVPTQPTTDRKERDALYDAPKQEWKDPYADPYDRPLTVHGAGHRDSGDAPSSGTGMPEATVKKLRAAMSASAPKKEGEDGDDDDDKAPSGTTSTQADQTASDPQSAPPKGKDYSAGLDKIKSPVIRAIAPALREAKDAIEDLWGAFRGKSAIGDTVPMLKTVADGVKELASAAVAAVVALGQMSFTDFVDAVVRAGRVIEGAFSALEQRLINSLAASDIPLFRTIGSVLSHADVYIRGFIHGLADLGVAVADLATGQHIDASNMFSWLDPLVPHLRRIAGMVVLAFEPITNFITDVLGGKLDQLGRTFGTRLPHNVDEFGQALENMTRFVIETVQGVIGGFTAVVTFFQTSVLPIMREVARVLGFKDARGEGSATQLFIVGLILHFTGLGLVIGGVIRLASEVAIIIFELVRTFSIVAQGLLSLGGLLFNLAKPLFGFLLTAAEFIGALVELPAIAVIAIGAAIIALGVLIYYYRDQIWDFIKSIGAWIKQAALNIVNGIADDLGTAFDAIRSLFAGFADIFMRPIHAIRDAFANLWDGMKNGAKGAWNYVKGIFGGGDAKEVAPPVATNDNTPSMADTLRGTVPQSVATRAPDPTVEADRSNVKDMQPPAPAGSPLTLVIGGQTIDGLTYQEDSLAAIRRAQDEAGMVNRAPALRGAQY